MVRNLLFDLGGVVMDIRRSDCVEAFKRLGMTDADKYLNEYAQAGPFEKIENGSATIESFHEDIRSIIGRPELTDREIDEAYGRFLIGIPLHRLHELTELRKRFGIYMLSNTNPIMWADGISSFFAQEGHDVNYYFDGIVRSYEARVMKPAPGIFQAAIDRFGFDPRETIFLDDSEKNLEAARKFGFQTLLVAPGQEFYDLLKQYPGLDL